MRYVIHPGQPKAGSTSLQAFFKANAAALMDRGILYPLGGLNGRSHNHAWLGKVLASDPERVSAFARSLRGAEVVILSGEHFFQKGREWVEALRTTLERECGPGEFRAVVYFRNLPDQVLSRAAQEAKTGRLTYAEFIGSEFGGRTPQREIRQWEAALGEDAVDVRLLEAAAPTLPQDFMAAAGLSWQDSYVLPPRENVSPDPITAQVLALLRQEWGVSHRASRVVEPGWKLPKLENAYLRQIEEVVGRMKLKHPKLERFGDALTEVHWRDEAKTPDLGAYLDALIRSLEAIRQVERKK